MTATTMVTLDEVLRAAGNRKAALAPETSGYFALAIGDATARLPLGIDDRAVALTTEGAVLVPRKGNLVAPADAARTLRDALARLLAVSAGTMPGLAAAAKPRVEADVDGVVASIEGALIPVNRSAARRALARLARETLRAKEAGKLGAVRAIAPVGDAPLSIPQVAKIAAEPPPPPAVYLTGMGVEVLIETSQTPEPYVMVDVEMDEPVVVEAATSASSIPVPRGAIPVPRGAIEAIAAAEIAEEDDAAIPPSRETTPTLLGVGDVGVYITAALSPSPPHFEGDSADLTEACRFAAEEVAPPRVATLSGMPGPVETPRHLLLIAADLAGVPTAPLASFEDDEAITNALPLVNVKAAGPTYREPAIAISPYLAVPAPLRREPGTWRQSFGQVDRSPTTASSVDDLLARFNVTGVRDEHRIAQSLKTFVGIDLTTAPPIIWESPRPRAVAELPPPSSNGWETSPPPPPVRSSRAARFGFAISAAILTIGLVGTSMLWRFRPDLFGGSAPRATPNKLAPPATPSREPHAGIVDP